MGELKRRDVLALGLGGAAALLPPGAARAEAPLPLMFSQLYKSFGVRGLVFSDLVQKGAGGQASMTGFMAPPLRAESVFFVLTKEPLAICPFCQSDADWPVDIVVVFLKQKSPLVSAGARVTVTGRLEIGSAIDPDSGFVSQLRLAEANFRKA